MKQLGPFMILNIDGGDRVSFRFNEIDKEGKLISENNKKSFCLIDEEAQTHVEWLRKYIRENHLEG